MDRITYKHLQYKIDAINAALGRPQKPWTTIDGKNKANVGNIHLSGSYGRTGAEEMVNDGGGVTIVFNGTTKRELYELLSAYLNGITVKDTAA